MAYEIEIKAHIDSVKSMSERVEACYPTAVFEEFNKNDIYFGLPDNPEYTLFRLRENASAAVVTKKIKRLEDSIEINDEIEFAVGSPREFMRFAEASGYSESIRKQKTGRAYYLDGVLAEISEVEELGAFIELEILLSTDDPGEIAKAKMRLRSLLEQLGIAESSVETRRYTEMLLEKRRISAT